MATVINIVYDALPRLAGAKPTGTTFYQAINYISSLIGKRLINRRSDLLQTQEMSLDVTPADQLYNLPPGFISFAEEPFSPDSGCHRRPIEPLEKHRSYYQDRTALVPCRYNLLGQQIEFLPAIDPNVTSVTIKARYYALPGMVAGPTVTVDDVTTPAPIPFNSMFDFVFFQGVPRVIVKGLAVVQADPDFEKFLYDEVDTILNARVVPLPDRRMERSSYL
jgi:hypothetical protein